MTEVVISSTGLFTPPESISNAELVASFNSWVDHENGRHAEAIARGEREALAYSSTDFIEKASGIKSRYVVNRSGILDPARMVPDIPERPDEQPSLMCEMGVTAARDALRRAGVDVQAVDGVIVAASNLQRPYPAIAIEIQAALGARGYAYDMNVACSSATFAIQQAADSIRSGSARAILVINPEICTGHLNFRDRDSHFIFGDVCTAVLLQRAQDAVAQYVFSVVDSRLQTIYSNNIRNNFGFLNRADERGIGQPDKLFVQEGRKVFKEVCPAVATQISEQIERLGMSPADIRRLWLHQANLNMNQLIARRVLGREPTAEEAPIILDEYANTSSAGSVIAFHKYHRDIEVGESGILCSFGAGYSIGSVVLRRTR